MTSRYFSDAYVECLSRGPFPGRIDPWAQVGHHFQQIHSGLIDNLISQMNPQLLQMGYVIAREASLQIAEGREPDIFVQRAMDAAKPAVRWNYELAATEVLADPGVVVEDEFDLHALHIKDFDSGRLVTIVEIISPNNKTKPQGIADYRARRERLLLEHAVNVVEIDPTRSVKHLFNNKIANEYAYHVVVYLPDESPYFIGIDLGEPLKRLALPLRGEVIPVELQRAYDYGYQEFAFSVLTQRNPTL
jgi:hypothetical protein